MFLFGKFIKAPFLSLLLFLHNSTKSFLKSAPIAYPIAKLLDYVLGANEAHTYKKAELKSFLQFHRTGEEPLRDDEITILNGVLELNSKNVETIMTPLKVSTAALRLFLIRQWTHRTL